MIRVYHGPMYSGKTKHLVGEYGDGHGVMAFRPSIDKRYGGGKRMYSKESGVSAPATLVPYTNPNMILSYVQESIDVATVIIDEASFFPVTPFLTLVERLVDDDNEVVIGGLAYDTERNPWGPILELLQWGNVQEIRLEAHCDGENGRCDRPAIWTHAKVPKSTQLKVGSSELYGASCNTHYSQLHVPST